MTGRPTSTWTRVDVAAAAHHDAQVLFGEYAAQDPLAFGKRRRPAGGPGRCGVSQLVHPMAGTGHPRVNLRALVRPVRVQRGRHVRPRLRGAEVARMVRVVLTRRCAAGAITARLKRVGPPG